MDRKKDLETCLVIVTGLLFIYLIQHWFTLLIVAVVIGFIGIFLKKPASWITWLWYKIADLLGKVVPKIILSLIYFIFLFPISLLSRVFNKKSMRIDERKTDSLWIDRGHIYVKEDLNKPW